MPFFYYRHETTSGASASAFGLYSLSSCFHKGVKARLKEVMKGSKGRETLQMLFFHFADVSTKMAHRVPNTGQKTVEPTIIFRFKGNEKFSAKLCNILLLHCSSCSGHALPKLYRHVND